MSRPGVTEFLNLGAGLDSSMGKAILHAVFDESGKFNDHDVTSLCGWVCTYDEWDIFAKKWEKALSDIGIPELHTAEFMRLHGQYLHLRMIWGEDQETKKNDALTLLCNVLRSTMGKGIGATIDSKHYRSMPDHVKRAIHKSRDPHFISFQEVLSQAIWNVDRFAKEHSLGSNAMVGLIFDQDEQQAAECLSLLNKIKKVHGDVRERVSGICFCDRKNYSPLQAADLVAYLTKKEIERRTNCPDQPVSKWFKILSAANPLDIPDGLFNARIFDAECLNELAERVLNPPDANAKGQTP